MSTLLERRLQLLLDQERYDRVAQEAERTSRSVAAVIRSAIDIAYPGDVQIRMRSADRFLELSRESGSSSAETWEEIKAGIEDEIEERLPR